MQTKENKNKLSISAKYLSKNPKNGQIHIQKQNSQKQMNTLKSLQYSTISTFYKGRQYNILKR